MLTTLTHMHTCDFTTLITMTHDFLHVETIDSDQVGAPVFHLHWEMQPHPPSCSQGFHIWLFIEVWTLWWGEAEIQDQAGHRLREARAKSWAPPPPAPAYVHLTFSATS